MERRAILVRGIVQGVGFRPFVYGLACRLGLHGFVRNQSSGVWIEAEGDAPELDQFLAAIHASPPPLARVEQITVEERPLVGEAGFSIDPSLSEAHAPILIAPDVATCPSCLVELLDPADRRFGYPFLNCTHCGPRLTIVTGAPYDRAQTTMAGFAMCSACRAEYDDPANRRFHAQATACPACGPWVWLTDRQGQPIASSAPIERFAAEIQAGRIGALKGLGGFHLVCDARNGEAVETLRRRKHRDEKPFALMVANLDDAAALCHIHAGERALLESPRRPIVLLARRSPDVVAHGVAPSHPTLGVMLPYTPLHELLMRSSNHAPLVMTSGNHSDEPIAHENEDALTRLADLADVFLLHNRPIHVRCDDSVTRLVDHEELPLRRSRGHAPEPIRLPRECPAPILAVGGQLKVTFGLGRGGHAILSHHLGDLDHLAAHDALRRDIALYLALFDTRPELVAHDSHPDYASTRYAHAFAADHGCRLVAVQHHHAHMASVMAENGLDEPVIGVTFDGTGLGEDGTVWGGEFLVGDHGDFRRAGHLRTVGLPGGDRAAREPWRMALAHLVDAELSTASLERRLDPRAVRLVRTMLERRINTPITSSAGRLFDAVAALAGIRDVVSYEGQAAMQLEDLATGLPAEGVYPFDLVETSSPPGSKPVWIVDTRPLIRAIVADAEQGGAADRIARRFHSTLVAAISAVCIRLRSSTGLNAVVLSGGVFMNALLTSEALATLKREGFRVYRHRIVPPNDGGLSLGQLAVAAARASIERADRG